MGVILETLHPQVVLPAVPIWARRQYVPILYHCYFCCTKKIFFCVGTKFISGYYCRTYKHNDYLWCIYY